MANEPTEAQKKAGNYKKDHVFAHGMRFSVENKAGTTRKGTGKDGKPWEFTMAHDYGYVRGSKGKDKDHVDVFFGPDRDKPDAKVFVIDQDDDEGNFDEHKAMLGFPDASAAYAAYHENYPEGHGGFRALTEMSVPEFRKWAYVGAAGGKRKRVSELAAYKRGGSVEEFPDGAEVDPEELQEHFNANGADEDCACGNDTVMPADRASPEFVRREFAEGGAVEKPYIGARGRRAERNNDREGAKELPLQILRGAVAGTLGLGGDTEKLGREFARSFGAEASSVPALPTSEFFEEILPLKPTSAAGRLGAGAGNMAGVPLSLGAAATLRGAKGALTRMAERGLRKDFPEEAMDARFMPLEHDYARGGAVMGEETVGQARFNPSEQGRSVNIGGGYGGGGGSYGGPIPTGDGTGGLRLPQPLTDGNDPNYRPDKRNAPVYGSGMIGHTLMTPYAGNQGVLNPALRVQPYAPSNPGAVDASLYSMLQTADRGGMFRGANAFLGGGFNPWAMETGPSEGELRAPADQQQQIDQLFELGSALGIDTGKYSRNPGSMDIRGNRSGTYDAMGLYDAINNATKDYIGIGGVSQSWSGGAPGTTSRTIYKEVGDKLLPVTRPQLYMDRSDNGFLGRDTVDMIKFIGPALLGGFGGFAGLTGTAGTATGTAINAAGNAALGYASNGSQGALSSLLGSLGGYGGGQLGGAVGSSIGPQYAQIGSQIGSQVGSRIPGVIRNRR